VRLSSDSTCADVLREVQRAAEKARAFEGGARPSDVWFSSRAADCPIAPDLGVELVERDGRLEGFIHYWTARYAQADVARLARHLGTALDQLRRAPAAHLSNLCLLDEDEWRRCVVEWNE